MKGADNNLFHHPLYSVTLSLLAAVLFLAAAAAENGVVRDSQQLISFKNALSNPGQLPTWQPTVSPCNFGGVRCNNSRVAAVDLSDFNLDTDFSTATFLLSLGSLESLSLRNCNISDSISSAVRLSCGAALASLDLSGNAVSGPISDVVPALAACPALAVLNLSRNSVDPLPHSLPRSAAVPSL